MFLDLAGALIRACEINLKVGLKLSMWGALVLKGGVIDRELFYDVCRVLWVIALGLGRIVYIVVQTVMTIVVRVLYVIIAVSRQRGGAKPF